MRVTLRRRQLTGKEAGGVCVWNVGNVVHIYNVLCYCIMYRVVLCNVIMGYPHSAQCSYCVVVIVCRVIVKTKMTVVCGWSVWLTIYTYSTLEARNAQYALTLFHTFKV